MFLYKKAEQRRTYQSRNVEFIYYIGKTEIVLTNREKIPVSRKNVKFVKEAFLRKN